MVFENKKVSFNIASEASYVYILSGQKLVKSAKKFVKLEVKMDKNWWKMPKFKNSNATF